MKSTLDRVRIAGIAAAVPKGIEQIIDSAYGTPETREKFITNTGVEQRHRCSSDLWCSDLVAAAAERLIGEVGWDREEIGALVFVTQSPDMNKPATACILQHRLGLSNDCAAFDVNLGCSGHAYGLKIVGSMLSERGIRKGLLLAGDASTRQVLPSRRAHVPPLFGDAGSATALEWAEGAPPIYFEMKTFGGDWEVICERRPGGRPSLTESEFAYEVTEEGAVLVDTRYRMKGEDVFNFAAREVPAALRRVLEFAGRDLESIDAIVLHQANRMINEFIRKRLRVEPERLPSSLADFGNTSSASIPLTIVARMRERMEAGRMELALCGFGVGASLAAVHCVTDRIVCPAIIEV